MPDWRGGRRRARPSATWSSPSPSPPQRCCAPKSCKTPHRQTAHSHVTPARRLSILPERVVRLVLRCLAYGPQLDGRTDLPLGDREDVDLGRAQRLEELAGHARSVAATSTTTTPAATSQPSLSDGAAPSWSGRAMAGRDGQSSVSVSVVSLPRTSCRLRPLR